MDLNNDLKNLFPKKSSIPLKLKKAGYSKIRDLLNIHPLRITPFPELKTFNFAEEGEFFYGQGKVVGMSKRPAFNKGKGRSRFFLLNINAQVIDSNGNFITLVWFNAYPNLAKKIEELSQQMIFFFGQIRLHNGTRQMANPQIIDKNESKNDAKKLFVQYPTVNTVSPNQIQTLINKIPTDDFKQLEEILPSVVLEKRNLIGIVSAMMHIHGRSDKSTVWNQDNRNEVERRLSYQFFFQQQVKVQLRRLFYKKKSAPRFTIDHQNKLELISKLPFKLTSDQLFVLNQIENDFQSGQPMMRLLQGDVGCGKTIIAFLAALITNKNKHQTAFMCPTESLAIQHYQSLNELAVFFNINIGLLLGSTKRSDRLEILSQLKSGEISLIIGTHALIQDQVDFKKLGLVIIDEQHKFGVEQRLTLNNKGQSLHTLTMTATPIPRSLCLAQYGDLDISIIKTMPEGRKGCQSRIITPDNFNLFLKFLKTRLTLGEQAYVVVPAIEESEVMELFNLNEVLEKFNKIFIGHKIAPLHGKMRTEEKHETFLNFLNKKIDILISTSVIEVGINNTNATVMAILNPERFGLSSLHQLRGRVGRGHLPGFFFLLTDSNISSDSLNRLKIIEKTTDGLLIAEEDLKIRGCGDLFGKEQSGHNLNDLNTLIKFPHLLEMAKEDALEIIDRNAHDYKDLLLNAPILTQTI